MNERLLDEPGNLTPERRLELLGVVALVISPMALVAAGAQYPAMAASARISHSMVVACARTWPATSPASP